jgi:hypothetical protein
MSAGSQNIATAATRRASALRGEAKISIGVPLTPQLDDE